MKTRKNALCGPPAGKPFCWYTPEMLLSPAFRDASINCRRLIAALEFENMNHAGTENGDLIMPYNQLVRWWGIPRRLIRRTIEEAEERGLIEERHSGWRLPMRSRIPLNTGSHFGRLGRAPHRIGNRLRMNGEPTAAQKNRPKAQKWHRISATK
jgi:hypothetical protein